MQNVSEGFDITLRRVPKVLAVGCCSTYQVSWNYFRIARHSSANQQKQILARQVSLKMIGKDTEPTNYSTRNASVGFMPEARCAGMSAALSPAEQRTRIVIKITAGSEGFTS